jgi:hypothetical protein
MSFMHKLFGGAPVQQVQQQTPPGNIPNEAAANLAAVSNSATAPNGTVPANTNLSKDGSTQSSIDDFATLWQTDTTKADASGQPLFNVSQEKLLETARLQSFKEAASPEQLAAIAAGGEQAVAAMMQLMEGVTQRGYAQSVYATTKLIEGALNKSNFAKSDDLESRLRDVQLKQSLRESNPVFSNPAYAPLLKTAQQQFQVKYPDATAAELKAMAERYLTSMANELSPNKQTSSKTKQRQDDDWSSFA